MGVRPDYVYVASSWRNPIQPAIVTMIQSAGFSVYDFRNPPGGTGFSWRETKSDIVPSIHKVGSKGSDWETVDEYLRMIEHPRAVEGFTADFAALLAADTVVLVLPCGKSAHLELGQAVGAHKRTAVLLENPIEPELMYRMVDKLARSPQELKEWLVLDE